MPVNSFEDYPLTWKPSKALLKFPMYISLSELLEQDIFKREASAQNKAAAAAGISGLSGREFKYHHPRL